MEREQGSQKHPLGTADGRLIRNQQRFCGKGKVEGHVDNDGGTLALRWREAGVHSRAQPLRTFGSSTTLSPFLSVQMRFGTREASFTPPLIGRLAIFAVELCLPTLGAPLIPAL